MTNFPQTSQTIHKTVAMFALIAFGFAFGAWFNVYSPVEAEIRKSPPRQAFQSGSERSEVYLKEIAGTLKRIENRLGQIDQKVAALNKPKP